MPGSRASVFGEAEDFQAALSADGVAGLLVTGRGQFRARMTQVALEGLRLAAVEEQLARIAFVAVPAGTVLVAFPIDAGPSPVWGGIEIRPREIIAFEPGQRLHTRTAGPSHWGAIHVLGQQLAHYGRAVSGTPFAVPSAARWRPSAAVVRELRGLHRAAVRKAEARAAAFTDIEAAHGLEQQLLHALIECLSERGEGERATGRRHRGILARFEDWLIAEPFLSMPDLCAALGVSDRLLRECCKTHLGMGPRSYRHLRGMQQVHRALRNGNLDGASVSEVARRHGFDALGRFATNYRALYGELPSVTLRRALRRGTGDLSPGRQRVKFS